VFEKKSGESLTVGKLQKTSYCIYIYFGVAKLRK